MSPETDNNLHPDAVETATAPSASETASAAPLEATSSEATFASGASGQMSAGAATAVARAPEAVASAEPMDSAEPAMESEALPVAASSTESATEAHKVEPAEPVAAAPVAEATAETAEGIESPETMDQLLEQFTAPEPVVAEGEIFDGRVLAVTDAGVVVDVGGKFEGLVPAQEFVDSGTPIQFGEGQTIEVERLHEHKDGYVLLSHVRAHRRRVWERIDKSYREHTNVTGKITERIKGGLVVDIGVRAFLPASQVELRPVHDLEAWKDREIEVRVLKLNRKRGNVVVSRRAILEEEQKSKRDALASTLAEGTVVTGKVKNVTDYGVFVDLGGMDGLLHVTDLVWGRVPHPSTVVKPGEDIEVQILKFDKEKQRISLGRKQLLPDPWATVPERFPTGTRVHGKDCGRDGLRRIRGDRAGRRRPGSRQRNELVEANEASVENRESRRRRGSGGAGSEDGPAPHFARPEAGAARSVGRSRGKISGGHDRQRPHSQPGGIRRVRRNRRRLRRPDPRQRHQLDRAHQESQREVQEGRHGRSQGAEDRSQNRRLSLGIKQVNDIWANWFGSHKIGDVVKGKVSRTTILARSSSWPTASKASATFPKSRSAAQGERDKEKGPRAAPRHFGADAGQEYDFKILKISRISTKSA